MSIRVALHHFTRYRYDRLVTLGPQIVRLRPAPHCRTPILSYSLKVEPDRALPQLATGPAVELARAHRRAGEDRGLSTVTVDLTVELNVINPFDFFLEPSAEKFPFDYSPELVADLGPICARSNAGRRFDAYLDRISRESRPTTGFLFDLNAQLQHDIGYLIRMEPGIQTPDETLEKRSGSCRDSAWLLVQLLRHLGLGGALRLRLPDPAEAGSEIARRTVGRRGRFHRSARLVRSLSAGRGLGRARSDLGSVRGRRPYSAGLRRQSRRRRRRSAASSKSAKSSSTSR